MNEGDKLGKVVKKGYGEINRDVKKGYAKIDEKVKKGYAKIDKEVKQGYKEIDKKVRQDSKQIGKKLKRNPEIKSRVRIRKWVWWALAGLVFIGLIFLGIFIYNSLTIDGPYDVEQMTAEQQEEANNLFIENKGTFVCDSDIYNCGDFENQSEAQGIFIECGGPENDIHRLDADGNGIACEGLPK